MMENDNTIIDVYPLQYNERDLFATHLRVLQCHKLWFVVPGLAAFAVIFVVSMMLLRPVIHSRMHPHAAPRHASTAAPRAVNETATADSVSTDPDMAGAGDVIELVAAHFWTNSSALAATGNPRQPSASDKQDATSFLLIPADAAPSPA